MCVSAADREGEYLFWVPGQRSARERRIFHSFAPALSHYSALSIIPLTCVVTTDHRRHPDQLAASNSTATTTNTASSLLHSICTTPIPHKHLYIQRAQTAPWYKAFCKQSKEPASVFHVLQNPKIKCCRGRESGKPAHWFPERHGFIVFTAQREYGFLIFLGHPRLFSVKCEGIE